MNGIRVNEEKWKSNIASRINAIFFDERSSGRTF